MIACDIIIKLKQVNVSADAEKTKKRLREIWMRASKPNRETITAIAGVKATSVQRAYKTGSLSLKLIVPIAQTMNVNPYYLTGESDDYGKCTDALLTQLLQAHGYGSLLVNTAKGLDPCSAMEDEAAQAFLSDMTEEEMIVLLRAAALRAKAGGEYKELLDNIKKLLLS